MDTQAPERRWLSRDEVGAYLHIDPATVWRHTKAKRLPKPRKLGRGFARYDIREIDAAIASNGASCG